MPDRQSRIADWIASGTGLVKGGTLQVGRFTENSPERCVMVVESGGTQDMTQARQDVMYQVASRAISPADAYADSWLVYNYIQKNGDIILPPSPAAAEFKIDMIDPVTLPQRLGEDDKFRTIYVTNYQFVIFIKGGKL